MSQRQLTLAFLGDPASIHLRRWLQAMAGRGHRVHLLLESQSPDEHDPDDLVVHHFTGYGRRLRPRGLVVARTALRRVVDRVGPDILHAHYLTRYGWYGAMAGRHPFVLSVWGTDVLRTVNESSRSRLLGHWALRQADLVTGVTAELGRAATRAGAQADRVRVVQFGVDPDRFGPGPEPTRLRQALDLGGRRVVFAPRALRPIYRQAVAADALAGLSPEVALVMSRQGADPTTMADVEARAEASGTGSRLRLVDGIAHPDMADYYRLADVVLSVPESDAFSVTALEAMASGKPIVLSDLPAAREGLAGLGPDGWGAVRLVPVGDVQATAAAISELLGLTEAERRAAALELRRAALDRADAGLAVDRMESLYYDLAAGRAPRP